MDVQQSVVVQQCEVPSVLDVSCNQNNFSKAPARLMVGDHLAALKDPDNWTYTIETEGQSFELVVREDPGEIWLGYQCGSLEVQKVMSPEELVVHISQVLEALNPGMTAASLPSGKSWRPTPTTHAPALEEVKRYQGTLQEMTVPDPFSDARS